MESFTYKRDILEIMRDSLCEFAFTSLNQREMLLGAKWYADGEGTLDDCALLFAFFCFLLDNKRKQNRKVEFAHDATDSP
jgi:hypothetical protein